MLAHLQWVLGADGNNVVFVVAEFTRPGAPLADPLDEAGLVSAAHRPTAAAWDSAAPPADTWRKTHDYAVCILHQPYFFLHYITVI